MSRFGICALVLVGAAVASGCGESRPAAEPPRATAVVKRPSLEFGRNVVRVGGLASADVAAAAVLATFADSRRRPSGWLLVPPDAWQEQMVAAQFAAAPTRAAVLPIGREFLPVASTDLLDRVAVTGFRRAKGLDALVFGDAITEHVFGDMKDLGVDASRLGAKGPAALAAAAVPYAGGFAGGHSESIVVVSASDRGHALPAAAWSAYSGDTVAFVERDVVPPETAALLRQRVRLTLRRPAIYVIGPESVVSGAVERSLAAYGRVQRIAGDTPAETAVALARFHDRATGFGWGVRRGPDSAVLLNDRHPGDLVAALTLAANGARAPLLVTDGRDRLPSVVEAFLRELPTRSLPGQVFALGDEQRFASSLLSRVDTLLEPTGAGDG